MKLLNEVKNPAASYGASKLNAASCGVFDPRGRRTKIVSNEEIACRGCTPNNQCPYHLVECTKEHHVEKCSQCGEFPCSKISDMLKRSKEYQKKCREVCSQKEYVILEKAFFEKESNLMK